MVLKNQELYFYADKYSSNYNMLAIMSPGVFLTYLGVINVENEYNS